MKTRNSFPGFVIFVLASALISSLMVSAANSSTPTDVTIAFQGPLTGANDVQFGINQKNAATYAINLFNNSNSKYIVHLVDIDDQGDSSGAGAIAPTVSMNSTIIGVVGPTHSGAAVVSLPYYNASGLAVISPSASRITLTEPTAPDFGGPVFHRVALIDKYQGQTLAKYAISGVSDPKVYLVNSLEPYSTTLASFVRTSFLSMKEVSLVGQDSTPTGTTDYTGLASRIKAARAKVVIYAGYATDAGKLVKALRLSGFTGVFAGGDGVQSQGNAFVDAAGTQAAEGARITVGTIPLSNISQALEADFQAKMHLSSGTSADNTIDATNVFLTCISQGAVTRIKMISCVNHFSGKSIVGDTFSFDAHGDKVPNVFHRFVVNSGSYRLVDKVNFDSANILSNFPWFGGKK